MPPLPGKKSFPHLLEVLKIVEGAANSDLKKVSAYAEQLAIKLEKDSDNTSARRLRRAIAEGRSTQLSAARLVGQLPVDGESRLTLADQRMIGPHECNVFLSHNVSKTVEEFLRFVGAADRLIEHGVGLAPSLLLYGPPGCGKTALGQRIAARLELPLVTARMDGLISSYLGSTSKNVRALFEYAMSRPCVLFLDELDALAKLRDDQHELGELKRVVVSLLQNIDALDGKTVLIGATNHEHLLDPATWRRFNYKLRVSAPDDSAIRLMLVQFLGSFADEKEIELYAQVCSGLTGAEIKQAADDAKRAAIVGERTQVKPHDLLSRLARLRLPDRREDESVESQMVALRALAPKAFTHRRLAEIFDVSLGHVSNLLKRGGGCDGKEETTTD